MQVIEKNINPQERFGEFCALFAETVIFGNHIVP